MTTIRGQVLEFHRICEIPSLEMLQIPNDDRVRLRLRLVMEEAFEFLVACLMKPDGSIQSIDMSDRIVWLRQSLAELINESKIEVDLPEAIDGLGDLDYVVEGTRLEFGVDGGSVADEIHRANMQKGSGPVRADGKRLKPENFQPPDIATVLRRQGWKG